MDILKFLQEGNKSANPAYNPKTKKGANEPPFLVNHNPGQSTSDKGRESINEAMSRHIYDLNKYDADKYAEYNVYVNPIQTEEELNRERANNQSAWEQTGHALAQAGLNEIVLGTALSLSNIVDAIANVRTKTGENDYTNPVSTWLENLQNDVRNRFDIYTKDPNASWAIGDFGWWANGLVSAASTLSMLIPSVGVVKGLSLVDKLAKLGKVSRGIAKAAKYSKLTKNAASLTKSIDVGAEIGTTAFISRTMENYMEARGVYQETYNKNLDKVREMDDKQKEELLERNPNLVGKTDEEIASYISGLSADETFKMDYAMLLFDIAQFKAIGALWGKLGNKAATGVLRGVNKTAINNLVQGEQKAASKLNFLTKRLDNAKYALKNPLKSIAAIEWSEGLEEGYQGIQTERGKEVSEKFFNPYYQERSIDDYLTDSAIWEQAFWGVLGGAVFQVAGTGLGNLSKKVKGHLKKDKLTDEEFAVTQLSDEKIREKEIENRKDLMQDYVDKMQLIDAGYNPFDYKKDDAGEAVLQDGNKIFGKVNTQQEVDMLKENITNDFVTNLALNATDVGNYDLLKEFVNDPNFNKFFKEAGLNDNNLSQILLNRMDNANETYLQALHDVLTNTDVENQHVAKVAARHIARNRFRQEELEKHINDVENAINEDPDASTVTDNYIEKQRAKFTKERLDALYKMESEYIEANKKGELNDISFNIVKDRINRQRQSLLNYAKDRSGFGNIETIKEGLKDTINENEINNFVNEFNKYYEQFTKSTEESVTPKKELQDLVEDKVKSENQLITNESLIPKDSKGYKDLYNEIAKELDFATVKQYNEASEKIAKYLEDASDIKAAQRDLLEGNVSKDLKKALDIVKVASKNTNKFLTLINSVANIAQNDRIRKEEAAKTMEEDDKSVAKEKSETIKEEIDAINYSTGEQTQEETAKTSNVVNVENPAEFVPVEEVENIIDTIDPVAIQQAKADESAFALDVDDRAALYAQDEVINLFRTSPATLEKISSVDDSDAEFTKLVDYVTDQIIIKGVSKGIARQAAKNGIKLAFTARAIAMRNRNPDEASKFKKLSAEIAIRSTIKTDGQHAAITGLLSDKAFNEAVNQFMESYIKSHNIKPNKNGVYYIDVLDLFDALLDKDNKYSYETVKNIFRNLKDYILNFRGPKLKFINTKLLNQHLKNPETFIAALIETKSTTKNVDRYMHIKPATEKSAKYNEAINSLNSNSVVDITETGDSIDISKDGVQIGYVTKVKAGKDNNSYRLVKQDYGLVWEVAENPDGTITSNMDNLFHEVIDQESESGKAIYEAVQRAKDVETSAKTDSQITGADWITLMSNSEFKRLYENGDIKIPDNKNTNAQKAGYVLNRLANIIFYDNSLSNKDDILYSYNKWKNNIYDNYKNTNEIQNKLKENKSHVIAKITGIKTGKLKYSNIDRNVNELGFVGANHPMVVVMQDGTIMSEGSSNVYRNAPNFRPNAMGYLINDNPNAPMIALVTDVNTLTNNSQLTNDVHNEINSLIKDFLEGNINIDEIGQSLQDLLGSYGANNHNNLFAGYSVVRDKGHNFVALNINDKSSQYNGKYSLIINKDRSIVHIKNGDVNTTTRIKKYNSKTVDIIISDIISHLTFNKTFFSIRNNTNSNTNNNKYIYKRNGKLHVKIGGRETIYDNFSDFSIQNNAFKTNQGGNAITGYYDTNGTISSLYINVDNVSSPVEGDEAKVDKSTITKLIRSATKDSPVNTRDVLRAAGYSKRYIDALLGVNEFNIPIADESIYYDSKTTHIEAYTDDGKIYITNLGSGKESVERPLNLLRLVIHESIHKRVANEGLFEGKEHLVDELMDTYNAFMEALSKDDSVEANELKEFVKQYSFTPEQYFSALGEEEYEKWSKRTEEERRRHFAEEWLAESLSQPKIIQYLNRTAYDGAIVSKIDDSKKSIWQKIIDILIRLFDKTIGSVKDNTILAKQYLILGNEHGTTIETKNDTDVIETTEIKDNTNIETKTTEQSTTTKRKRRDRSYAITEMIGTPDEIYADAYAADNSVNPIGIQVVPDMNTYINQFAEHEKPLIASMIENNEIKFSCQ